MPCSTDGERDWIDGWFYQRHRGEYKFRKSRGTTDPEGRSRAIRDSLAASLADQMHDFSVDLREKSDFDFVRQRVDSLWPMERSGFYHICVKKKLIDEIERSGIKVGNYPLYPGDTMAPSGQKKNVNRR